MSLLDQPVEGESSAPPPFRAMVHPSPSKASPTSSSPSSSLTRVPSLSLPPIGKLADLSDDDDDDDVIEDDDTTTKLYVEAVPPLPLVRSHWTDSDSVVDPHRPADRKGHVVQKLLLTSHRRPRRRSWKAYYAVLQGANLILYKDPATSTASPAADFWPTLRPHHAFRLTAASFADAAKDYKKRKHVIRVVAQPGTELLLETPSEGDLVAWVDALNKAIKDVRGRLFRLVFD